VADAMTQAYQLCASRRFGEAIAIYEYIVASQPHNVVALINLGGAKCHTGDLDAGIRHLSRALEFSPDDGQIRQNILAAHSEKINQAMSAGDMSAALVAVRAFLAIDSEHPSVRANLTEILGQLNGRARLSDFIADLDEAALGKKILVACMPKSGSSWLSQALENITGFRREPFSYAFRQNEEEIYLPYLVTTARRDTVTQQHCRATLANLHLMQGFGIKPVVLVRNLLDALVSLVYFYDTGAVHNTFFYGDYQNLDRTAQLDLVIESIAPWYIQFFVSWVLAERENKVQLHWITYEDMTNDKATTLKSALAFYDLRKSDGEIASTITALEVDHTKTRFNKGRAGRGTEEMSDAQMTRVHNLTRFYPSIDFTPIGL